MAITTAGTPIPIGNEQIPPTFESVLAAPRLNIPRRVQREDAWCYAACASMAIKHVIGDFVSQCDIASFAKEEDCCDSSPDDSCTDSGCRKNQIKPIFEHFNVRCSRVNAQISFITVGTEIDADRPIEVVIDWDSVPVTSHAVLVTGFIDDDEMVYVIDPLNSIDHNTGWTTYESLQFGFGYGNWDMTWRRLRLDD